jgi:hypothetical protein
MVVAQTIGRDNAIVERGHAAPLSGEFSGDALEDLRGEMRIHQNGQLRLPQHIDEAGRDYHTCGIYGVRRADSEQRSHGGDPSTLNGNVPGVPGRPGAVDDVSLVDQKIVPRLLRCERGGDSDGDDE